MNLPNRFEDFVVKEVMLIHMFLSLSSFVIIQFCHYPALLKLSKEAIVQLAWVKHRLQWRLQTKCDIFTVKVEYFLTHRHAMWFLYFSSAYLAIKQCQCFRFSFRDCEHEEYVSMKQI